MKLSDRKKFVIQYYKKWGFLPISGGGEIGAGTGSSYPGSTDTDATLEIDDPAAGATIARADVPNDLAAAVVAIETELGTDPAGSTTNVKTFLQLEHNAAGTHKTAAPANVTKSAAATGSAGSVSLSDHKHDVTSGAPSNIGTSNTEGSSSSIPRLDHTHDHVSGLGTDLHHTSSHTHASHTSLSANDHHAQSHTLASHTARNLSDINGGGTLPAGTVPLARIGTSQLDSSTAVSADSQSLITIQTGAASDRFYIASVRSSSANIWYEGPHISGTESIGVIMHYELGRPGTSGGNDTLKLINGTGSSETAVYKVYDLTET